MPSTPPAARGRRTHLARAFTVAAIGTILATTALIAVCWSNGHLSLERGIGLGFGAGAIALLLISRTAERRFGPDAAWRVTVDFLTLGFALVAMLAIAGAVWAPEEEAVTFNAVEKTLGTVVAVLLVVTFGLGWRLSNREELAAAEEQESERARVVALEEELRLAKSRQSEPGPLASFLTAVALISTLRRPK